MLYLVSSFKLFFDTYSIDWHLKSMLYLEKNTAYLLSSFHVQCEAGKKNGGKGLANMQ